MSDYWDNVCEHAFPCTICGESVAPGDRHYRSKCAEIVSSKLAASEQRIAELESCQLNAKGMEELRQRVEAAAAELFCVTHEATDFPRNQDARRIEALKAELDEVLRRVEQAEAEVASWKRLEQNGAVAEYAMAALSKAEAECNRLKAVVERYGHQITLDHVEHGSTVDMLRAQLASAMEAIAAKHAALALAQLWIAELRVRPIAGDEVLALERQIDAAIALTLDQPMQSEAEKEAKP